MLYGFCTVGHVQVSTLHWWPNPDIRHSWSLPNQPDLVLESAEYARTGVVCAHLPGAAQWGLRRPHEGLCPTPTPWLPFPLALAPATDMLTAFGGLSLVAQTAQSRGLLPIAGGPSLPL
jgi:hypothetical protein